MWGSALWDKMTSHKHDFQWHGRLPIGELAKLLFKLGHGGVNSFDFLVAMITSLLKYAIMFLLQTGLLIASLRRAKVEDWTKIMHLVGIFLRFCYRYLCVGGGGGLEGVFFWRCGNLLVNSSNHKNHPLGLLVTFRTKQCLACSHIFFCNAQIPDNIIMFV